MLHLLLIRQGLVNRSGEAVSVFTEHLSPPFAGSCYLRGDKSPLSQSGCPVNSLSPAVETVFKSLSSQDNLSRDVIK